jgi:manganese transport protein
MIETLSEMYVPAFGTWTKILFLIGAWAVLFKTLYVSSASNSRLSAEFLGLTGIVRLTEAGARTKWISRFCVFFPTLALLLYFWQRDPRGMVIIGGFFQAATLPLLAGAALFFRYRRTDPRLAPSRLWDVCLWLAFLTITAVALFAIPHWAVNECLPAIRGWFE